MQRAASEKSHDEASEALLLQLHEVMCLQTVILMKDFNHLVICWENSMERCKQTGRLLESIEGNFLVQALDRTNRGEVLLDLVLTNAEEIIKELRFVALWAVVTMPW